MDPYRIGALLVFGARIEPGDLDVVPEASPANLRRLGALLDAVDAVAAHHPGWAPGLSLEQCRAWRPDQLRIEHFDHMFVTRLGILDVPTRLTGTYDDLRPGATRHVLNGYPVWVCDPAEVLRRLTDRAKDRERTAEYAAVRRRLGLPAEPG